MTTRATIEDRLDRRSGIGTQLLMTAVSLVVIGGFVLWQVWPLDGRRSSATEGVTEVGAPAQGVTPLGGMSELYAERDAAAPADTEWLYIVESEAHAQTLIAPRRHLTDANDDLWEANSSNVVWFDSEETEARFWQMQGGGDVVRDHYGLPRLMVIDLRDSGEW
jgi:hypothetical protein